MALVSTLCAALCLAQPAASPRTSVRALEQTVEGSVLRLKGAVEITSGDVRLQADEATFNVVTGQIEATGPIRFIKASTGAAPKPAAGVKALRINVNQPGQVILRVADKTRD